GTGALNKKGTKSTREYRTAKYSINGKFVGESSFVTSILVDNFQIDQLILVGTAKSMWEEVYGYFCKKNGIDTDLEYYSQLGDKTENANYQTPLNEIDLSQLQEALGEGSEALIIPYGLTREEQIDIF